MCESSTINSFNLFRQLLQHNYLLFINLSRHVLFCCGFWYAQGTVTCKTLIVYLSISVSCFDLSDIFRKFLCRQCMVEWGSYRTM